ncbi:MAG: Tn3 family transposase [Phormidesmis sp.]
MPSVEETAYPRLTSDPSLEALETLYKPTDEEITFAKQTVRGDLPTVVFLVLLKTFQTVGYPVQLSQVPTAIIRCVAASVDSQLTPEETAGYDTSGTRQRHVKAIRQHLAVQPFFKAARQVMVAAMETAVETQHDLVDLINVALEELVKERYQLPAFSALERAARDVRAAYNNKLYQSVSDALSGGEQLQLSELFYCAVGETTTLWREVKQEPGSPKLGELQSLVERLRWLQPLQVAGAAFSAIPEIKRTNFAAQAQALDANQMKELPEAKRQALTVALLQRRYAQTLDDIAEVFIKRMRRMHYKAKEALENYRIESQQRTDELISKLRQVAIAHSTDGEIPDRFAAIGCVIGEHPDELIAQCDDHLAYAGNNYLPFLPKLYRSHRAVLFRFLSVVPLFPSTQDDSLTAAITFIRTHRGARKTWLPLAADNTSAESDAAPAPQMTLSWVPTKWWTLVTGEKNRATVPTQVHRQYFELCVFSHILLGLKSGDLYIEGSSAFGNYLAQLISWDEMQGMLADYVEQLGLPTEGPAFVEHVRAWLSDKIEETDTGFPANTDVYFKADRLVIRKAKAKNRKGAKKLKKLIAARMKPVNLLDVLVDTQQWLKWTEHFKPVSGYEAKMEKPVARYLATTFCYGCNIGPSQLAQSLSLFDRKQISRVNQRHISDTQLHYAVESVVNGYNRFALPKFWGVGKSASVDGTKWDIYENNLLAEYHIRYGGYGGLGYYHVADNYIALFSHFIPCGVFEALYLFDGLLNNHSDIQPDTLHGDTHSQSLTVFGLAYLLGIKLMPRIRNLRELTFFRADAETTCQHIDVLFSDTVDWDLIETHLPDMLRVVLSIMAGKISASTILRKLSTNSRKNKLFKAFHALGSAVRTGFLMEYIHSAKLRAKVQGATNKSESFNAFVQWLAFGNMAVLRTNDREELRKRIKYNHLVANCVILYNVFEMSRILNELAQEGHQIAPAAVAGINPYASDHLIRLGQYHLDDTRQPPPLHYDLPFSPPPEAA